MSSHATQHSTNKLRPRPIEARHAGSPDQCAGALWEAAGGGGGPYASDWEAEVLSESLQLGARPARELLRVHLRAVAWRGCR